MVKEIVKIGGKRYSRVMAHQSKAKAQEHAAGLRKDGWSARVIREGGVGARFPWVVVYR